MKKRVLITSFYSREAVAPAIERLSRHAEVVFVNDLGRSFTEDEIIEALKGYDGVIAAEEPYTKKVFSSTRRLRIISRDGVGLDNIDITEATRHGVAVTNAPVLHESVADLAFGLIISAVRKLRICDIGMREGRWTERERYLSRDVYGRTLGLLGFGKIAQAVARRASGFGMKVIACDTAPKADEAAVLGVKMVPLDELLLAADIISIHVPLTPATFKIINNETIGKMKDGVFLVNTSRGGIIDEPPLINALRSGKIAGAGLDVVCCEPPDPGNMLFGLDNVIFTPHVGSDTADTFLRIFESAADDMISFFTTGRPVNLINPEVIAINYTVTGRQGT